jgi:predicted ATPase
MGSRSERDEPFPVGTLANFASWYRHLAQEHIAEIGDLHSDLREVLPGFATLEAKNAGGGIRYLVATFETPGGPRPFDFGELSDGQRTLIALSCLRRFSLRRGGTVCIDEPDNLVALLEIQPWMNSVIDNVEDGEGQVLMISHHPELLNQLAASHGVVFRRDGHGPVRAERFQADGAGPLTPAELVARGWDER